MAKMQIKDGWDLFSQNMGSNFQPISKYKHKKTGKILTEKELLEIGEAYLYEDYCGMHGIRGRKVLKENIKKLKGGKK